MRFPGIFLNTIFPILLRMNGWRSKAYSINPSNASASGVTSLYESIGSKKHPSGIEVSPRSEEKDADTSQSYQTRDADSYKNIDLQDALIRINEVESELENANQELSSIKKSKTWLLVKILWKITGFLRIAWDIKICVGAELLNLDVRGTRRKRWCIS